MRPIEAVRRATESLQRFFAWDGAQVLALLESDGERGDEEASVVLEVVRGGPTPVNRDALTAWLHLRRHSTMDFGLRRALVRLVAAKVLTLNRVMELVAGWRDGDDASRKALRDEFLSLPVPPLGSAHNLVVAAARAMPPEAWPQWPVHGGGPSPKLLARGYVEVGLLALREAVGFASADKRALVEAKAPTLEFIVR